MMRRFVAAQRARDLMDQCKMLLIFAALAGAQGGTPNLTVLHTFTGQNGDGEFPYGQLAFGPNGALYGTTGAGGITVGILTGGIVFELNPPIVAGGQWTETIIHTFQGGSGDGLDPNAGLVLGPTGSFYGTTYGGGGATNISCVGYTGCGTVFELTPPTAPGAVWTESIIYRFQDKADGGGPGSPVIFGPNGVIYGTTSGGLGACYPSGISGCGTVFALHPPVQTGGAWTEVPLHHFDGADGKWPYAGLVLGQHGELYGTTAEGGAFDAGTVF